MDEEDKVAEVMRREGRSPSAVRTRAKSPAVASRFKSWSARQAKARIILVPTSVQACTLEPHSGRVEVLLLAETGKIYNVTSSQMSRLRAGDTLP